MMDDVGRFTFKLHNNSEMEGQFPESGDRVIFPESFESI